MKNNNLYTIKKSDSDSYIITGATADEERFINYTVEKSLKDAIKTMKRVVKINPAAYFKLGEGLTDVDITTIKTDAGKLLAPQKISNPKNKSKDADAILKYMRKIANAPDGAIRPEMKYIYFDPESKKAVATDAHRLIASGAVYDAHPEFAGYAVNFETGDKELLFEDGQKHCMSFGRRWPDWKTAMPKDCGQPLTLFENPAPICFDTLQAAVGMVHYDKMPDAPIAFNMQWYFEISQYIPGPWCGVSAYKPIISQDDNLIVLLMPMMITDGGTDYIANLDKEPEPEPEPTPEPEPETTTAADTPTSEKTDTPTVKKFEVGMSYYCRSFCDYDCIFTIDIIERKGNKITLKSWDNSIRKKIVKVDNDGVEWFRYDRYSMAPIYRADKETAPEEAIRKEVETTAADDPAAVDAHFADLAAHDTPANQKNEPTPANQKPAATDAEVMETAARIRANYEAMQADIEAEREQAAAAFAEVITAYCEELSRPEPLAWEPETIIIPFEPRPAAEVEQPRRRHRLNLRPRLSRWLHPARWVAVAFVVCLLSGLLLGMNTSTAGSSSRADAAEIVAVVELEPVTVTAPAPLPKSAADLCPKVPPTFAQESPAPSPVKKAAADAVTLPGQKTASDIATATAPAAAMATATDAAGLTVCEGTPWAYTMMNWA